MLLVALAARGGEADAGVGEPADPAGATLAAAGDLFDFADGDLWEIPDMQEALRDAWVNTTGAAPELHAAALDASGACGEPRVAAASCPALIDPELGWWTGSADRRNAFLMSVLVRDNYPMKHNLGADGDDTPEKKALWQCLLRAKWLALGADRVEFFNTVLNDMVVIKAGAQVFVNFRGTWTRAHRESNMEWRLLPRERIWGAGVRYHTGWGKTAEEAYAALKKILADFDIPKDECKMWISGHSRGGGVALLTAAFADGRDAKAAPCKVGGVWTFGSVKPFDPAFTRAYSAHLGSKTWNWWNQIDVVGGGGVGAGGWGWAGGSMGAQAGDEPGAGARSHVKPAASATSAAWVPLRRAMASGRPPPASCLLYRFAKCLLRPSIRASCLSSPGRLDTRAAPHHPNARAPTLRRRTLRCRRCRQALPATACSCPGCDSARTTPARWPPPPAPASRSRPRARARAAPTARSTTTTTSTPRGCCTARRRRWACQTSAWTRLRRLMLRQTPATCACRSGRSARPSALRAPHRSARWRRSARRRSRRVRRRARRSPRSARRRGARRAAGQGPQRRRRARPLASPWREQKGEHQQRKAGPACKPYGASLRWSSLPYGRGVVAAAPRRRPVAPKWTLYSESSLSARGTPRFPSLIL
jgi:hypothetical protein